MRLMQRSLFRFSPVKSRAYSSPFSSFLHCFGILFIDELRVRGCSVDVGVVYENAKNQSGNYSRVQREIDFIATKGNRKFYIQSAFAMPDEEKRTTELKPFSLTGDSFPKIVVRQDIGKPWYDEQGVLNIGLVDFLLDRSVME